MRRREPWIRKKEYFDTGPLEKWPRGHGHRASGECRLCVLQGCGDPPANHTPRVSDSGLVSAPSLQTASTTCQQGKGGSCRAQGCTFRGVEVDCSK